MNDPDAEGADVELLGTTLEVPRSDARDTSWRLGSTPPEQSATEVRAISRQRRRLLARMFGSEVGEDDTWELGHYLLLGELGDGGMGRVYEAYDRSLDRKVAIKTLLTRRSNPDQRARLVREAKAMARLTHPNVVRVYEIGETEAGPHIVMEFVEGRTLRAWLGERERTLEEIVGIMRAVGCGLIAIHAAGLVHRDVKPDNIMIDVEGRVLVMDLGLAHGGLEPLMPQQGETGSALQLRTKTGALVGTPYYMSPEQFDALVVTDKADQYSFCATLWEAVYGQRPVQGGSIDELAAAVKSGARQEPDSTQVPAWLRRVLDRGMAVEPDQRFGSMAALVDALAERPSRRTPSRAVGWPLSLAAVVGLGLVLGRYAVRQDDAPAPDVTTSTREQPDAAVPTNTPTAARQLAGHTDIEGFRLLPGEQGIIYIKDGALWHRRLDASAPRRLYQGPVWQAYNVGRDGVVFFSTLEPVKMRTELYRLRDLDSQPELLRESIGDSVCTLPDSELLVSTFFQHDVVDFFDLRDVAASRLERLQLNGEFDWIWAIACDPVNGRVAVLTEKSNDYRVHMINVKERDWTIEEPPIIILANTVNSIEFADSGSSLYYLADRGRGFELEMRALGSAEARIFAPVERTDGEIIGYSISSDGQMLYQTRGRPRSTIRRIGNEPGSQAAGSWQLSVPAWISSVRLSPDERSVAYVEHGVDAVNQIDIVELASSEVRELPPVPGLGAIGWSPDGRALAFVADHRGVGRVQTVTRDGQMGATLNGEASSDPMDVCWAARGGIIYKAPRNQTYVVVDPESRAEHHLVNDELGFPTDVVPSHSGNHIAMMWNRSERGLWTVDIGDGETQQLLDGDIWPIAWSRDDRYVFAVDEETPQEILRVPAQGGEAEVWHTLDGPDWTCTAIFEDGDLLCHRTSWDRELWLLERPAPPSRSPLR